MSLVFDPAFEIIVHVLAVTDNIHRHSQLFFKVLLDTNQIKEILLIKHHNNVNVAFGIRGVTRQEPKMPIFRI